MRRQYQSELGLSWEYGYYANPLLLRMISMGLSGEYGYYANPLLRMTCMVLAAFVLTSCTGPSPTPGIDAGLGPDAPYVNPCDSGFLYCPASATSGQCVNVMNDPANCGACNATCNGTCFTGLCTCSLGEVACTSPLTTVCTDLASDPLNCGACFNDCGPGPCVNGACLSCSPGFANCSGTCVANRFMLPDNCGGCGVVCDSGVCIVNAQGIGVGCGN